MNLLHFGAFMEDNFPVMPQSPKAARLAAGFSTRKKYSISFETMVHGDSKQIPYSYIPYQTLRTMASRAAKKMGVKFAVIKHEDLSLYELSHCGHKDD
jgi:hypothetical protein